MVYRIFVWDYAESGKSKIRDRHKLKTNNERKIMTTQITLNQTQVNITNELRARSGGIIKISDFAKLKGFNLESKDERKECNRAYTLAKRSFYSTAKQIAALAVADDSLLATRAKPVFNKAGEFQGVDVSHRVPSKSYQKTVEKADLATAQNTIAALQAEIAALKAGK